MRSLRVGLDARLVALVLAGGAAAACGSSDAAPAGGSAGAGGASTSTTATSSGGAGGATSAGGSGGQTTAVGGGGGAGGATSAGGSGGAGGGVAPPLSWVFTAYVKAPGAGAGNTNTEMAAHPSDAATVAFTLSLPTPDPQVAQRTGCRTTDLGVTGDCVPIASVPSALSTYGLGYDPAAPSVLVDGLRFAAKATFYASKNGGVTYDLVPPWIGFQSTVLDARFLPGPASAFVVRTGDSLYLSSDDGASYTLLSDHATCQPPNAAQVRSFAVAPYDTQQRVVLCEGGPAERCVGDTCAPVQAPAGLTLDSIAVATTPPGLFVALAHAADGAVAVVRSTDGGKTFTAATVPVATASAAYGRVAFSHGQATVAIGVDIRTLTDHFLWRSLDGGATFVDVTPPGDLEPAPGVFRVAAFDFAADGAMIALSQGGGLARLPAPCSVNADCAASPVGHVCDPGTGACVACATNADCGLDAPTCDPATKTCVACKDDGDCAGSPLGSHCGPASTCVCASNADCAASPLGASCDPVLQRCGCAAQGDCAKAAHPICLVPQHACTDACITDADCKVLPGEGPFCDAAGTKTCVMCVDDADCVGSAAGARCDLAKHDCGCLGPADCSGDTPVCDAGTGRCQGCATDGDCKYAWAPHCNVDVMACAACVKDADCTDPAKPKCIVPPDTPLAAYCM